MQEMRVWSLDQEDPLEKEKEIHASIFTWKISWSEEPGGLQSRGSQKSQKWLSDQTTTTTLTLDYQAKIMRARYLKCRASGFLFLSGEEFSTAQEALWVPPIPHIFSFLIKKQRPKMRNPFFFFEFLYSRMATCCFFHSMSSILKYHLSNLSSSFSKCLHLFFGRERKKQTKKIAFFPLLILSSTVKSRHS